MRDKVVEAAFLKTAPREICRAYFRGLKRWDGGRWVTGSLVYRVLGLGLLHWGIFPIPHLPSSHLLSLLMSLSGIRSRFFSDKKNLRIWFRLQGQNTEESSGKEDGT